VTRPLTGIPADKARSYASIEAVAAGLRQKLNLEMLERFDALDFFEKQIGDIVIIDHGKEIKMVEAIDDCPQEGMTRWDTESQRLEIVLAQRTYDMLQENHVRARSTVAHETGHAVLHTAQIIRLAGMNLKSHVAFHRDRNPHKAYLDTEWQANAFASSLLMPAEGVKSLVEEKNFSTTRLERVYGVSEESATYRLETYRRSLGL
jgi:predicted transcriptional regulator